MSMFWVGFALGLLFLFALFVVIALCDDPKASDARRVAREVREAKRQIDLIFADTKRNMERVRYVTPPRHGKED